MRSRVDASFLLRPSLNLASSPHTSEETKPRRGEEERVVIIVVPSRYVSTKEHRNGRKEKEREREKQSIDATFGLSKKDGKGLCGYRNEGKKNKMDWGFVMMLKKMGCKSSLQYAGRPGDCTTREVEKQGKERKRDGKGKSKAETRRTEEGETRVVG